MLKNNEHEILQRIEESNQETDVEQEEGKLFFIDMNVIVDIVEVTDV